MARIARIVVPGLPHHVTQRGSRRGQVFFEEADYALYLDILAESAERARCEIWACCDTVPIILVPSEADSLRHTFADLHRLRQFKGADHGDFLRTSVAETLWIGG